MTFKVVNKRKLRIQPSFYLFYFQISDGIELSNQALARDIASPQNLTSRCHLHIGIGYSLQATNAHVKQEKQYLIASALEAFLRYENNYIYIVIN